MNALAVIRKLHMSDLLLPVGAALVTAGIEALAARERRQRDRLAALQASVSQHVDALLSAGAPVPDELLVDELHPFDAPGLAPDYRIAGNGNPETSSNSYPGDGDNSSGGRGRRWKLAALALVAGTATYAYVRREQIGRHIAAVAAAAGIDDELAEEIPRFYPGGRPDADAPFGPVTTVTIPDEPGSPWDQAEPLPEPHPHSGVRVDAAQLVDECVGAPECGHGVEPSENLPPAPAADFPDGDRAAEPSDEKSSGDECGWTGCTWAPKDTTRGAARVTALAVHRSKCPYRPPSMTVPGA